MNRRTKNGNTVICLWKGFCSSIEEFPKWKDKTALAMAVEKACASGRCVDSENAPGLSKSLGLTWFTAVTTAKDWVLY